MVNAQEWLNSQEGYNTTKKRLITIELDISNQNLQGKLDLSDFVSLKKLYCSQNQLTELDLAKCSQLVEIDCWDNQLTSLKVLSLPHLAILNAWNNNLTDLNWQALSSQTLLTLSLSNNNFPEQGLSCFSKFVNLEGLWVGNDIEEKINNNICNRFSGSLKYLKGLTKLKRLQIEGTELKEKSKHLPKDIQIICWGTETIIKKLGLTSEKAIKLRQTNQENFSEVLHEIMTEQIETQSISTLTFEQEGNVRKLSNAIAFSTQSEKGELKKNIEKFQQWLSSIGRRKPKVVSDLEEKKLVRETVSSQHNKELLPQKNKEVLVESKKEKVQKNLKEDDYISALKTEQITSKYMKIVSEIKNFQPKLHSKVCEFYYNTREIRYDKVYPELPWDINNSENLPFDKLPTRLYDIETKQVENKEYIFAKGIKAYAALSYVWGNIVDNEELRAKLAEYSQWNKKLNSDLTPSGNKALLKAIEACNLLGIKYLWMDKLCVNQNNPKEKAREVAKMKDYYSNSTVTLIAIQAEIEKELFNEWRESFCDADYGFKDLATGTALGIGAYGLGAYELVRGIGGWFRRGPDTDGKVIWEEVKVDEIGEAKYYGVDGDIYSASEKTVWEEQDPEKAWQSFFILREITDLVQQQSWKESGLDPTWSNYSFSEADKAWKNNWKDLTINSPSNEMGQIKDWQKGKKMFTYISYDYETKEVNFLQHNKKEIDKVHKLLVNIIHETDPTKLPNDEDLKAIANYNLVPISINLEFLQKVRDEKENELWSPFFTAHDLDDKHVQKVWKSTGLTPQEAEITYNNGWTDLTINSSDNSVGKIFVLGNKTFTYISWRQTTEQVNPLIQTKFSLDTKHLNTAWEKFFVPRGIVDITKQIAWKNSDLNPFEEAETAYDDMQWHDLTINSPDDGVGLIENWNKEDKTFTYISYGIETQKVKVLKHNKLEIDKIHKLLVEIAHEFDPTRLPSYEKLENLVNYELVPNSINLATLKRIRDEKENELWNDFFVKHNVNEEQAQQTWKKSGFNPQEAEKVWNNGWEELGDFSITDKKFSYKSYDQRSVVDPLIHDKNEVDQSHSLFSLFEREVKINSEEVRDFIDLPEYSQLIGNNRYEEKKVPSTLRKSKLRAIWEAKKVGVKKNNKFKKWVDGVDSPYYSLRIIEVITNSEWFERTWTFQEGLLSKQTIFMFDNVLVDGRAMARFWDSYENNYESLSTIFSGEGEKFATPLGWTYHKNYNLEDVINLSLGEALGMIKKRKSTVAVDGIYSILGLLPYGHQVKASYKSRVCLTCPNQEELIDCSHSEENKQWPIYTQEDLNQALMEIMKVAVTNGYGEPLAWFGSSNEISHLGWMPHIDENGCTSVKGGKIIKCLPNSVIFTEQGMEINGSEHLIILVENEDDEELYLLEKVTNLLFWDSTIHLTIKLKIGDKLHTIVKDESNSLCDIKNGDVLIIPNKEEWGEGIAILATKGEDNVRYRKGLLLINTLVEEVLQQRFVISSKKEDNIEKKNEVNEELIAQIEQRELP